MRISSDENDTGYSLFVQHFARRREIKIRLDGTEVREAITADDDEAVVVRHRRDEAGKLVVCGDEFVREILRGRVEIILPGAA